MESHTTSHLVIAGDHPTAESIAGEFLARYPKITRDIYRIHIRQYFDWLGAIGVLDPLVAKRGHIEAWGRHLDEDLGRKPQTVASKLNSVIGFYRMAHQEGYIAANPAQYVRRPHVEFVSTTRSVGRTQFADLLAAAEQDSEVAHAMVCLLGLSGLRIGETLAANIEHIGQQRGYTTLHLPKRKGGQTATISLAVPTVYALDRVTAGRTAGPILLGRDGQRLKIGAARRIMARLCKAARIEPAVSPHGLRHAFTTMALDAGVPERDIVNSCGWSDRRMVQYYDRHRAQIERNATHAVAAFVGAAR